MHTLHTKLTSPSLQLPLLPLPPLLEELVELMPCSIHFP